MTTLSVVLIVKNESENIEACLESVSWADEIVLLDSGSEDDTVIKARKYTDKIFVETDWQGYGIQRQRAQVHASCEWVLMLDADERVTPELKVSIQHVLSKNNQSRVYAVPRLSYCFGRFIRHSGWYPDYVTRLYPSKKAQYNDALVHEKLQHDESLNEKKLKGDLLHYTYRDLHHYLVKSASYAKAWADQRQQKGKRTNLLQGFIHGVSCFLKMYLFRAGFLDGRAGLLLATLSAHSTFAKYADLWVRQQETQK